MTALIIFWLLVSTISAVPTWSSENHARTAASSRIFTERNDEQPVRILKPAVHRHTDLFSIHHVEPSAPEEGATLFFSEEPHPVKSTYMASTTYNFTGPVVVIDHSAYMSAAADGKGHLTVDFSDEDAYKVASESWPGASGMVLVGHIPGCGNYAGHERCYFKVASLSFDKSSLSCVADGVDSKVEDVITHWEIKWDLHIPSSAPHPLAARQNSAPACTPPPDTKYSLPTACVGPNFDQQLDNSLGAVDWRQNGWYDNLDGINEEITADDDTEFETAAPVQKRFFGKVGKWVQSAASTVAVAANQVKNVVVDTARKIPIAGVTQPAEVRKDFNINLNYPKPGAKFDHHPVWKNAKELYSYKPTSDSLTALASNKDKMTNVQGKSVEVKRTLSADMRVKVYCVDCSVVGKIVTVGSIKGSLIDGVQSAAVELSADLTAVVQLGVDAQFELAIARQETKLGEIGVEGILAIPGVISLGPYADISIEVVPKLTLSGTLFVGAQMTWRAAKARLAFGSDGGSSASGWTPEIKPVFNASGEIGAAIEVAMPIGLKLGISIFNGKFERNVAIEERPSIEAKASIGGSLTQSTSGTRKVDTNYGIEQCKGIKAAITFKNDVSALYTDPISKEKKPLYKPKSLEYEKVLWEGCLNTGSGKKRYVTLPEGPWHRSRQVTTEPEADGEFIDIPPGTDTSNLLASDWTFTEANVVSTLTDDIADDSNTYVGDGVISPVSINAYNTSDGFQYTQVISSDYTYMLASCSDGNIYAQYYANETNLDQVGCGTLWAYEVNETAGAIMADGGGRLMHYYPSTMNAIGVSRLRTTDMLNIPFGVGYIAFLELQNPNDGTYAYYPVDLDNNFIFALAVCQYTTGPAKAFIVRDQSTALDTLASPDVKYSVTGGDVVACYTFPMMGGSQDPEPSWSGVGGDLDFADQWLETWEVADTWDGLSDLPEDAATVTGVTDQGQGTDQGTPGSSPSVAAALV